MIDQTKLPACCVDSLEYVHSKWWGEHVLPLVEYILLRGNHWHQVGRQEWT